ncbi:MAG: YlqD family protein [Candidatus Sericytochromatia bacterium]|nr:YlqD family protein [Candidatus Sericytochromatia bacterium]
MVQSLSLRRQVVIKTIVTESFKQQAMAELQQALGQLDEQAQELEFQARRAVEELQKRQPEALPQLEAQINEDRQRLGANKAELLQRLQVFGQLSLGQEFVQGNVENFVDVAVGDAFYEKMASPEIVIKDGVVIEIRTFESGRIARV